VTQLFTLRQTAQHRAGNAMPAKIGAHGRRQTQCMPSQSDLRHANKKPASLLRNGRARYQKVHMDFSING